MISVMILTLNEEANIRGCLESVAACDDVVVLDSGSTDRTADIAREMGARLVTRAFDNWAAHQNWAMQNIEFRHPWVFYLDADEQMTPELWDEIQKIAADAQNRNVAYYCGRWNFFMGRKLKHAMPPGNIMRFFKPPHIRFERLVNPTPVIDGPYGYLRNKFLHWNFSKGLEEWIAKHNRYSTMEAKEGHKIVSSGQLFSAELFSSDRAVRRQAMKRLSFGLPCSPWLRFVWMYLLKGGWLDGYPGLIYCRLQAMYQSMIVLKMKDLRLLDKGGKL